MRGLLNPQVEARGRGRGRSSPGNHALLAGNEQVLIEQIKLAVLMCRHPRLGAHAVNKMGELPDELWTRIFGFCGLSRSSMALGEQLRSACHCGDASAVSKLVSEDLNIDQVDKNGCTPLFVASQEGKAECVKLLLASGAAVDQADREGRTPLFIASFNGKAECVKLLLASNAAFDKENKDGFTPLFVAGYRGSAECMQLLLVADAAADEARKYWQRET